MTCHTPLMEPADMFWGVRFGRVGESFGHQRGIATHLRDMTPAEIKSAAVKLSENMAD